MSVESSEEFNFVCPTCRESLSVNTAMKDALIENGCVICHAVVSADAFTRAVATDSR